MPAHSVPNITAHAQTVADHGAPVGGRAEAALGTAAHGAAEATVHQGAATSAVVASAGPNTVDAAQSGSTDGTYRAEVSASSPHTGPATASASNTPTASGNGSAAQGSARWASPGNDFAVTVSGGADFSNMQIPHVKGGLKVKTPFGTYTTPRIG